jgi:exonuclease VII small subunit
MVKVIARIERDVFRGRNEIHSFVDTHSKLYDHLDLLPDHDARMKLLENGVELAKRYEAYLLTRHQVDNPTTALTAIVHRLEMEIRLEKAKKDARK